MFIFFYSTVKTMSSIGKQNMRFCMPSKMQNCSIPWNLSQETAFRLDWLLITYSQWECHSALLSALCWPCVSGNNLSTRKHRSLSAHYLINKVKKFYFSRLAKFRWQKLNYYMFWKIKLKVFSFILFNTHNTYLR